MANQNNLRARRGLKTLKAYKAINGSGYAGESVDEALSDLLADLMHWGSRQRRHSAFDKFEGALETARMNYAAELADPS